MLKTIVGRLYGPDAPILYVIYAKKPKSKNEGDKLPEIKMVAA